MKTSIIGMLALGCLHAPCHGQDKKENTADGVNFETGHYVTIVLREKLVGNQLVSIATQEEKLQAAMKEEDFDPLALKTLHTRETLLVLNEKASITLAEKFLQLPVQNAELLGKLCMLLSKLDVHEIFVSKTKNEGGQDSLSNSSGLATQMPHPAASAGTITVQPSGTNNTEIARIISRLLDISVLVLQRR